MRRSTHEITSITGPILLCTAGVQVSPSNPAWQLPYLTGTSMALRSGLNAVRTCNTYASSSVCEPRALLWSTFCRLLLSSNKSSPSWDYSHPVEEFFRCKRSISTFHLVGNTRTQFDDALAATSVEIHASFSARGTFDPSCSTRERWSRGHDLSWER